HNPSWRQFTNDLAPPVTFLLQKRNTDPQRKASKGKPMNRPHDNTTASQDARNWSEKVGILAAQMPATSLPSFDPLPSADAPTRLSTILHHFRQRQQRRADAEHKLRAQEFVMQR